MANRIPASPKQLLATFAWNVIDKMYRLVCYPFCYGPLLTAEILRECFISKDCSNGLGITDTLNFLEMPFAWGTRADQRNFAIFPGQFLASKLYELWTNGFIYL